MNCSGTSRLDDSGSTDSVVVVSADILFAIVLYTSDLLCSHYFNFSILLMNRIRWH